MRAVTPWSRDLWQTLEASVAPPLAPDVQQNELKEKFTIHLLLITKSTVTEFESSTTIMPSIVVSQFHPPYILTSYYPNIHSNVILRTLSNFLAVTKYRRE
jgi:hypothetical protein